LNQTIQSALIAADRLFEILDVEREDARGGGELKESMLGDIVVEDLTFNHPGRTDVLVGVNIRFEKGKITALTGESGCGKSTLLALLQRLYPQEKGRILIGDTDIRTVSVESLRRVIGVIPQQVDLLSGSITENVAIGDFPPDLGRIERVCQMASFSEFVKSLPSGYDTILSEDGKNLSGGQRQRLALARVFYRDSHILLLDEPSSALDAASEQVLLRTLKLLKAEGKTIIIVAHKRRLVSLADKVFRIEKGKAVPIPPVNGKIHDGELDVDQPITIACDGTLDERKASVAVSINE
jgi:ATP-binding cassette subfamily B protein